MMLTRCPACQTVFRLGPEQLHARRGEVRCGHCFHPFNALEHEIVPHGQHRSTPDAARTAPAATHSVSPQPPSPPPLSSQGLPTQSQPTQSLSAQPFSPPPSIAPQAPPAAPLAASDLDFGIPDDFLEPLPPASPAQGIDQAPTKTGTAALPEVVRSKRRPSADTAHFESTPQTAAAGKDEAPATKASAVIAPEPEHLSATGPQTVDAPHAGAAKPAEGSAAGSTSRTASVARAPAAMDSAEAESFTGPQASPTASIEPAYVDIEHLDARYGRPRKPASAVRRTLAGLGVGLLGGLLAAQCVYLYRSEIARELPGLRPLLAAACAELGCELPFPRDAALIGLDASDLQSEPGKPGHYVLNVTVNNRADYAQTWPHMELTLTDGRELPIARRVLGPEEWLPPEQRQEAFASHDAVNARIPFAAPQLSPTGYRVYIFYP